MVEDASGSVVWDAKKLSLFEGVYRVVSDTKSMRTSSKTSCIPLSIYQTNEPPKRPIELFGSRLRLGLVGLPDYRGVSISKPSYERGYDTYG